MVDTDHSLIVAKAAATRAAKAGSKIYRLQYMRAIAAVSVLLFHASWWLDHLRHEPLMIRIFKGWLGVFGVKLFFAISGYLMAELASASKPGRFLAHRVLRIYPIYWISVGATLLLYRIAFGQFFNNLLDPLTLLLIPGLDSGFMLGVEWTLPFELTFYFIVFLFVLVHAQQFLPVFAALWIGTILVAPALGLSALQQESHFPAVLQLPFTTHCLPFAGGLMIPLAIRQGLVTAKTGLAGAALVFAATRITQPDILSALLISAGCVLIVAFSARPLPAARRDELPILSSLGDWSFALYLCHVPILVCYYQLAPQWTPPVFLWAAAVTTAIAVSMAWGKMDVRLYGRLKRWVDQSPDFVARVISALFIAALVTVGTNLQQQKGRTSSISRLDGRESPTLVAHDASRAELRE